MIGSKVLIVTGASSGIGRALARQAVGAGYNVVAVGRRGERLEELKESLGTAAPWIVTLALDLRQPNAARTIVQTALEKFGRIDAVVNNAGLGARGPLLEQTYDEMREQFDTHVIAPVALVREAREALRRSRGHVFMMGSGVARVPITGFGVYPGAKSAVRSIARVLRVELAPDDITVTYIDPGLVSTEFHTRLGYAKPPAAIAATPEQVAQRILQAIPTHQRTLNAVPWQAFFVGIGALLPAATDVLLARFPGITAAEPVPALTATQSLPAVTQAQSNAAAAPAPEPSPTQALEMRLDVALQPFERRMNKLGLTRKFVRGLLVPDATLFPDEIALRWAGMPNKNERALTHEVLNALAEAKLLEHVEDGYVVGSLEIESV